MNNPFNISDNQLEALLTSFIEWYQKDAKEKDYAEKQKQRAESLRNTLLNKQHLENTSDDDLFKAIKKYLKTLEGPVSIHLGEERITDEIQNIKRNLRYLIDSQDEPFQKAEEILEGKYKIKFFSKAFWSPILQAHHPQELPNWNNKTENFLKKLGVNIQKAKLSTSQKYKLISDAFSYLKKLDSGQNFFTLNHLMHYGTAVKEGSDRIDRLRGIKSPDGEGEKKYWQIAPGEKARLWDDFKSESIAAIGWGELNLDLKDKSKKDLSVLYKKTYAGATDHQVKFEMHQLLNFLSIKPGDKIIANKGKESLLGVGEVKSGYKFRPERSEYRHTVDVDYYRISDEGIPIPSNLKGKFGKTIVPLTKTEFETLEALLEETDGNSKKNAWIFQANPAYYDLIAASKSLKEMTWGVSQNKTQIHSGDTVYLWNSGLKAGIVAVAEITSEPKTIAMPEYEKPFIQKQERFQKESTRVYMAIRRILEPLILKETLLKDEILSNLRILKSPRGSNFLLSQDEADRLKELTQSFSKDDALRDLFLIEEEFDFILSRLKAKKNIILQGPPGVGKTFIAKRLAYTIMKAKDDSRVIMIQFHQSYSYEDFIQGFRPNHEGKFDLKSSIFYDFCLKAQHDLNRSYFFIIDEINRGNLSKIFGEILMLIETDKRGEEFALPLTYAQSIEDKFYIPENLYIIGTMNTADRSLAMVDYALRRRFTFIDLEPEFQSPKFETYLKSKNLSDNLIIKIKEKMTELNKRISEDTKNLGPGYQIGHSYFCPNATEESYNEEWYLSVIKSEIKPLLKEYWFDDPQKVDTLIDYLKK